MGVLAPAAIAAAGNEARAAAMSRCVRREMGVRARRRGAGEDVE